MIWLYSSYFSCSRGLNSGLSASMSSYPSILLSQQSSLSTSVNLLWGLSILLVPSSSIFILLCPMYPFFLLCTCPILPHLSVSKLLKVGILHITIICLTTFSSNTTCHHLLDCSLSIQYSPSVSTFLPLDEVNVHQIHLHHFLTVLLCMSKNVQMWKTYAHLKKLCFKLDLDWYI